MKFLKKLRRSLSFSIISFLIALLVLFSWIISIIGYFSFSNSLKTSYNETTVAIAKEAATLVNPDHFERYLKNGGKDEEYLVSKEKLDTLCETMDVTLIYIIQVDQSDYGRFTSIFNSVNKDSDYTPWEIGYQRETTNNEYAQTYRQLYTGEKSEDNISRTRDLRGAKPHLTTLLALKDSEGKVNSILCVQRMMSALESGRRPYLTSIIISVLLTSVLVAYIATNYLNTQFIWPVNKIIGEAKRFAKENTVTNCEDLQTISSIEELNQLANAITKMEKDNASYIDNIKAITSEKERIGVELNVASKIQAGSVPSKFPAYPDRSEFDIYANMRPAKEVGGDFYDFFLVDDDHLALVMADVSGKGIPAALFMMVTKILIKEKSTISGGTPEEIIRFVNDRICNSNSADMFVTIWFGILELSSGKITCVNAGHEDPAIYRSGKGFKIAKDKHCLVVGAMEGARYTSSEIQLQPGDKLFLYTDGVPEATNGNDELFTLARLEQTLNAAGEKNPSEILESVTAGVDAFVGEAPQFDDLTMLCLQYNGTDNQNQNTLHIEADNKKLDDVIAFLESYLERIGCPIKLQMQLSLAVEEIFVNIANYAYAPGSGFADIKLSCEGDKLSIVFEDSGVPYNPLQKADPNIKLSAEERQIGGLGIFMTKKITDDIVYRHEGGKNILKLVKIIK